MVPSVKIPRASFDRTFTHKTTINSGFLIPLDWQEIYPGDSVVMNPTIFGRLATPINPVMDNMWLDVFWFFCQNRILWDNWTKFMGEQDNPGDSISFTVPQTTLGTGIRTVESLYDYMGLPTGNQAPANITVNALPFRAYYRIWNEWFRDQNLQNSLNSPTNDGPDDFTYSLQRRGKRHDYFTSSLPAPQKGDSVSVPIGTRAPIGAFDNQVGANVSVQSLDNPANAGNIQSGSVGTPVTIGSLANTGAANLFADLSNATASTINQLRQSFQLQRLLERDMRGGTRYPEVLESHFGVIDPSLAVHQRPVYLGGGTIPINITPIAQTSQSRSEQDNPTTPQGNLAAMGTLAGNNVGFRGSFTEHGILMCLVSVRADLTYQQGIHRFFSRQTRYDYYWPALSHIGEQAVLLKEIYAKGDANDEKVWGYQERHAELRYAPNRISGSFRSGESANLDAWHLAQNFVTEPALNASFIEDNPPVKRVIAVQNEPEFIIDCSFKSRWIRPMPVYGVPGMIDHF